MALLFQLFQFQLHFMINQLPKTTLLHCFSCYRSVFHFYLFLISCSIFCPWFISWVFPCSDSLPPGCRAVFQDSWSYWARGPQEGGGPQSRGEGRVYKRAVQEQGCRSRRAQSSRSRRGQSSRSRRGQSSPAEG